MMVVEISPDAEPKNCKLELFLNTYFPNLTCTEMDLIFNDCNIDTTVDNSDYYGGSEINCVKTFSFYKIYENLKSTKYFNDSLLKGSIESLASAFAPQMVNVNTIEEYNPIILFDKLNKKVRTKNKDYKRYKL
jgi:hypothetical protein